MTSPCRGGFERVLYGWGNNAPAMSLAAGVGYSVGPGSAIQSLVLQVAAVLVMLLHMCEAVRVWGSMCACNLYGGAS